MFWWRLIGIGLALLLAPGLASAKFLWFGKKKVERVQIVRAPVTAQEPRPEPPLAGRSRCVAMNGVAGAVVFGDRAVELSMRNGSHWRVYFAQQCPTLSFYAGFYYRRAEAGQLCAGRDAIISRSGGECTIASIVPTETPRHRR
jgi:hypothetical protein